MSKININLSLSDSYAFPTRRMEDEFVVTGVTLNSRVYLEIDQYCIKYKTSDTTVRRLLKKVEHAGCNEFFIKLNNKIYVSPCISVLTNENFRKLDDINGNWEKFLRGFEWDFFGCVSFKSNLQLCTAKVRMTKFFEAITKKFKAASIRLFYTCEKNPHRKGYHTHFILWSDNADKTELKSYIENHFRGRSKNQYANTEIEKYNPKEGGVGYLLKEMTETPDGYDYLYKNKAQQ